MSVLSVQGLVVLAITFFDGLLLKKSNSKLFLVSMKLLPYYGNPLQRACMGLFFPWKCVQEAARDPKKSVKVNFHRSQLGIDVGKHRPSKKAWD
jgi:hypothetical protein